MRERKEKKREREIHTIWRSINGPSNRGRVWLTLKLDELL
jgi:hypothetical protein